MFSRLGRDIYIRWLDAALPFVDMQTSFRSLRDPERRGPPQGAFKQVSVHDYPEFKTRAIASGLRPLCLHWLTEMLIVAEIQTDYATIHAKSIIMRCRRVQMPKFRGLPVCQT